jgi:hypothetical protein
VDFVWEQEKPEARKMLENAAESPASSARFVGQPARLPKRRLKRRHCQHAKVLHTSQSFAIALLTL